MDPHATISRATATEDHDQQWQGVHGDLRAQGLERIEGEPALDRSHFGLTGTTRGVRRQPFCPTTSA